jgi:hypothetical protein
LGLRTQRKLKKNAFVPLTGLLLTIKILMLSGLDAALLEPTACIHHTCPLSKFRN